jgi:serine/threonine-protein kinase RsbW
MAEGFRMMISADLGEVSRANAAFADFAAAHAVPAQVRRSLNVALDELLANTVTHGLAGRAGGAVTMAVDLDGDRLTVTLRDNGAPFDPFARDAPDTTLSVEDRPIGGLGIHLVRQLVDQVSYRRDGDHNVVVLTSHLGGGTHEHHTGGRLMEITTRTQGGYTIVAIAGNLDSVSSPQAQQALDGVIAGGAGKVAVDFTQLDYISSAGLRVMLGTAKQLMAKGGGLRTFGLNQTVREVFDISGFSSILAVYGTESEALK